MQYKTRGGKPPQSKPSVYFSCHSNDFERCFSELSDDILLSHDCAIWYNSDSMFQRDEDFFTELSHMQLMVIPVSADLLRTTNDTISKDLPFAINNGIPVLPIMLEYGLDVEFNRIFGDLHYLFWRSSDVTAIAYKDKLEQFLNTVLTSDTLAEKIRLAFDAYIFLSYRKKDRKYARNLMRLIHENAFCRSVAIWYDEYLTPGENFNDLIYAALKKSNLFVLMVTPNVINEVNYIMTTEYPMAQKHQKPILPIEMVSTDQEALSATYQDIPPCVNVQTTETLHNSLHNFFGDFSQRKHDAQHKFFIGLAYLGGIDVEVNHELALSFITSAANQGLPEAAEKLISMYTNGIGVQRNQEEVRNWSRKLAAYYYEKAFNEHEELIDRELVTQLFSNCNNRLWDKVIAYFLQIADERVSEQTMYDLAQLAVSQIDFDYSSLFSACNYMPRHRQMLRQYLLESILQKTAKGIYKPYSQLFCWPIIEKLFEETLLAAQQVLANQNLLPNETRLIITLLRDLLVISGYDCVHDVIATEKIPLLLQAAAQEPMDNHRARLNILFYFPEKTNLLRENLEPDHLFPQIFSLSYLMGMETELCGNQPFSDPYKLWDQIDYADSIGLTAINFDTLDVRSLDYRSNPDLITGAICCSEAATTHHFFGLSNFYPHLSLLVLPINCNGLEKQCFSFLTKKSPHLALCLPSGIQEGEDHGLYYTTGLWDLPIKSLFLYANNLARIPGNLCNRMSLRRVRLPECIRKIGGFAFYDTTLTSIQIPDNVEEIETSAFGNCGYLSEVQLPKNLRFLGNHERGVSGEKHGAFQNCRQLRQIVIPKGTEFIGHFAFSGCSSLKSVCLPESVEVIGMRAFYECTALETVQLPDTLQFLALSAFSKCRSLRAISIPLGITSVSPNVFDGCSSLQAVDLPETLVSIGQAAFANCVALRTVRIPDSVTEIQNCAFENCSALEYVYGNPGLITLNPGVFYNCRALKEVPFIDKISEIQRSAFENCESLHQLVLPESVKSVTQYAFRNCTGLAFVTAGNSTILEEGAFEGCDCSITGGASKHPMLMVQGVEKIEDHIYKRYNWVQKVVMDASVRTIGRGAFSDCSALQSLELSPNLERIEPNAFYRCIALSSVSFPETLTHIGKDAFDSCSGLTSLELPINITCLEDGAFTRCTGLTSVRIPESLTALGGSPEKNIFVDGVFQYCSNLKQVILHDDILDLGAGTFSDTAIESIRIPQKVTVLKNLLFAHCSRLSKVILPDGLQKIEHSVFKECTALQEIELPESLKEIGMTAFYQCKALKQIRIPENVTNIGALQFVDCYSLEEVILSENLLEIKEKTFFQCASLERILLPKKLSHIGSEAFSGCANLREISLPMTLREIEKRAFFGCASLQAITIPEGIVTLPQSVFSECKALQRVELPDTLVSIEDDAFFKCHNLHEVYIPDSVERIGSDVFSQGSIQKISVPTHLVPAIEGNLGQPIYTEETASRTIMFY